MSVISLPEQRRLVVSFHDLHPGTMQCCVRFISRVRSLGVERISLLVVPNWYGGSALEQHPDFCSWLRDLPHDISLHGLTHQAVHRHRNPIEWLVANQYTAGEGEFYKLSVPDARQRVVDGLKIFEAAGIQPGGFIAPAWLMPDEHRPLLSELGLYYAVTFSKVYDLRRDEAIHAPVLCTTSRTRLRRLVTRQVVSAIGRRHAASPVLRIAVHPVDFQHPEIETFIYRLIGASLETRASATYLDLVTHQDTESAGEDGAA